MINGVWKKWVILVMKDNYLLPIGTVVTLKNGTKKTMIVGFKATPSNADKTFDYIGVLYPEGYILGASLFFDNADIKEIHKKGYSDDEEKSLKTVISDIIE